MGRSRDVLAVLGAALLSGALLAYALLHMRETTLRSGEELTDSLSLVIAEQTARTLQSADQALRLAAARLDALRRAGAPDTAAAATILQAESRDAPFIRDLWVTDAQGRVAMASRPQHVGRIVAGMPPAEAWSAVPAPDLHVGTVQRDETGQWQMLLARAVREGGKVREVMVAAIDPRYFEQSWRGIDLGATGAVVLYRRDGRLMVRSPGDERVMGQDFSQLALFREYLPRAPEGTFIRESTIDGVRRVVAYRSLPGFPDLLVAVGTGFDELLAPWRKFAALAALLWTAAVIAAVALTLQLRRHSRRSHETRQSFWQLAQAMPQIVFIADQEGGMEFVNQRWTEVTGYPREQAMGAGWRNAVHPDDLPMLVEQLAARLKEGKELQLELRLRSGSGTYRWQLLRVLPVPIGEGAPPSWFGTATDIDRLKEAQDTLRRQAEQLGIATRLTRMGSWRADLQTQRMAMSEEVCAVLDLAPDVQPTLQEVFAMLDPQSLPAATEALTRCIEQGESFDVELGMISAAGRRVWVRSVGEPIRDATGRVVAIQGAQQDITLRMLMMEEIRRLNASLEERIAERTAQLSANEAALLLANKQLEAFSYSVSHDLQSPLQRVGAYARLLQQELPAAADNRAQHYLDRILANADTMTQLIEGLLALAHVSEVELIRAPVNLSELAAEILFRLQSEQPHRRVQWQVQPGLAVQADARLVRSVLENLIGNAWKFTSGKAEASIVVGSSAERGEYFVRDTGVGFDMAYVDRLFGTFQRLHGEDEFPGTGIGLATVARAITRQGGRVWAHSAPGEGATFYFTLPPA
ncbi:PAS domain-containing protein [Ramlibacter sp. PS3R-8]|uniref:PAS domain-containing protein n=1 Tax=Ramlibacter sp. PS3R-8 TaxID=3133437 RepID=UPI00309ACBAB